MEAAMDDHDSATYSIESEPNRERVSIDDIVFPAVRRSAVQIVSLSPRRKRPVAVTAGSGDKSTIQITKLVLRTPPGSPKRQPKTPGVIVRSIQTFAGPRLTGSVNCEHATSAPKSNGGVLVENGNLPAPEETAPYRIIPILADQNKSTRKDFEVRRSERERATTDFQDFLLESFKENKTPPSTPPPTVPQMPTPLPAVLSAIEISHIVGSDTESTSVNVMPAKKVSEFPVATMGSLSASKGEPSANQFESQCAVSEQLVSPPIPAARRSLLLEPHKPPETVQNSITMTIDEDLKPSQEEITQVSDKTPSKAKPETVKITRSHPMRPKQQEPSDAKPSAKPIPNSKPSTAQEDNPKKKEKSYDPVKAREFMREQQVKRRQEKKETTAGSGGVVKGPAEKDLIKQRLETLRQSSQKLVSKNLQKARSRTQSCGPKETRNQGKPDKPSNHAVVARSVTEMPRFGSMPSLRLINKNEKSSGTRESSGEPKETAKSVPKPAIHSASSHSGDVRAGKTPASSKSTNPSSSSSASTTRQQSATSKKIGILRKPDSLALDEIVSHSPWKEQKSVPEKPSQTPRVNAQLIVINAVYDDEPVEAAVKELQLQVPDVTLLPTSGAQLLPDNATEKVEERPPPESEHHHPVKSIPPWLKQSLRQPDPYPFILAVRKKLEAVQNVREEETKKKEVQEQRVEGSRYHAYLNEIESVPYIGKNQTIRGGEKSNRTGSVVNPSNARPSIEIPDDGSAIVTKISPCSSNTTSEISSIKSDMVLPQPPLLSSTKIEVPNTSTAVGASINGKISPLSMERISQMKITTPGSIPVSPRPSSGYAKAIEYTHLEESNEQRPPSPPRLNVAAHILNIDSHMDRSQREVEFQRLLESFNRSLTHVIEVNQQLHSALKNSHVPSTIPPFPKEVLKIRDEMTQTSQPIVVKPVDTGILEQQPVGTPTTASNYSDDFEHQSQTDAPRTPEKQPPATDGSSSSTLSITASSSSSSASSSTSNESTSNATHDSNSSSSSSQTSSASSNDERINSGGNDHPEAEGTDDERKATSNTTTAQSSDLDSRSFSLSDSHNNTTNNHPPMPEEYLPSFEESLRKDRQLYPGPESRAVATVRDRPVADEPNSRESSISEQISRGEEHSFSFKHTEDATEVKVNASPPSSSSTESIEKNDLKGLNGRDMFTFDGNPDTTINSDLLNAMFNRTDLEVSILSTTVSETNLSYSSIGMYDQLIYNERNKEDHLVSRLHSKQKALLNRAKGQLAWLELQKQRYREKGMTDQISAVKKKQRAILLRLEKDRAELNRAIRSSAESSRTMTNNQPPVTPKSVDMKLNSFCSSPAATNSGSFALRKSSSSIRSNVGSSEAPQRQRRITGTATTTTTTSKSIQIAVRGRELEPNDRLEDILLRREEELRKRKEHVQRLLEWHRKLEREEDELMAVEDRLLAYNSRKLESSYPSPRKELSIEDRVRSIERSLKTLQSIPTSSPRRGQICSDKENEELIPGSGDKESEEEVVLTGGSKLNRLWHRLTGLREQRYEPGRNYPITRSHLEMLYEDAKRCVLEGFQRNDGKLKDTLLERSIGNGHREEGDTHSNTTESVEANAWFQPKDNDAEAVQQTEPLEEIVATEMKESSELIHVEEKESIVEEKLVETEGELPAGQLLSSTVNGWSPTSRRSIESVEFHTLEETATHYQSALGGDQELTGDEEQPVKSESYSMSFEENLAEVADDEESQLLIEDMSLPPMLLNTTSVIEQDEDSGSTTSCESSATVELSVPLGERKTPDDEDGAPTSEGQEVESISSEGSVSIAQSLEEGSTSSSVSSATTPTTVTPTLVAETVDGGETGKIPSPVEEIAEYEEDVFHPGTSSASLLSRSATSELEKRLTTLQDELEELSESFERTPLMKSPILKRSEERSSSEETITFEEGLPDDSDVTSPSGAPPDRDVAGDPPSDADQTGTKIEVKLRAKVTAIAPGVGDAIASGSGREFPAPPSQQYHPQIPFPSESLSPSTTTPTVVRMPDIINEAEVLRRQQLQIEQEIKELEQQVGFFREIPNKPPPPYIPPANGSPLALLFPSEGRIDELIDGRVEELYRDRVPPERLRSEHVTNVYEKLILDMCKEQYRDLRPPDPTVSFRTVAHDKRPLAFHNPPDALGCMKDYLRAKIRRVLGEAHVALQHQHQLLLHHQLQQNGQAQSQQQTQQQGPHSSQLHHQHLLHHHCSATVPFLFANAGCTSKRRPDQVDEILKQETHDDDPRWINFDREEIEVKDRITDELLKCLLADALQDMADAYDRKGAVGKNKSPDGERKSAM